MGIGQIGGTLIPRLDKLGYEVFEGSTRGPALLADFAGETGAKPVPIRGGKDGNAAVTVKRAGVR